MKHRDKIRKLVEDYCKENKLDEISSQGAFDVVYDSMRGGTPNSTAITLFLKKSKILTFDKNKRIFYVKGQFDEDKPRGLD